MVCDRLIRADLDGAYAAMGADERREGDAFDWAEDAIRVQLDLLDGPSR